MSVLAFKDAQAKVAELITADSFFTGEVVATSVGKHLSEVEDALRDVGQATIVYPIQSAGSPSNGMGAVVMQIVVPTAFLFNPEKGTKNIYDMVTNGIGAVISYFGTNNPNDRFRVQSLELFETDTGVWGYIVDFTKFVQFT